MNENKSPVVIGCDHAAYPLKEKIKAYIKEKGIQVEDIGTHGEASVDYPDFGIKVASMVSRIRIIEIGRAHV